MKCKVILIALSFCVINFDINSSSAEKERPVKTFAELVAEAIPPEDQERWFTVCSGNPDLTTRQEIKRLYEKDPLIIHCTNQAGKTALAQSILKQENTVVKCLLFLMLKAWNLECKAEKDTELSNISSDYYSNVERIHRRYRAKSFPTIQALQRYWARLQPYDRAHLLQFFPGLAEAYRTYPQFYRNSQLTINKPVEKIKPSPIDSQIKSTAPTKK